MYCVMGCYECIYIYMDFGFITTFFEDFKINPYFKNSENMREIPDNSIQLVITSPPYGTIKDYGTKYQIGFNDGFETYIQRLTNVWRECFRILEPQCRLVINVGGIWFTWWLVGMCT